MRTKDGALRISIHDGERSTASCIITRENFKFNFAQSYQRSKSSDRLAWLHVSAKGKAGNPSDRLKIKIIPRRTFLRVEQYVDWPASRRSYMNRCLASIRYDFRLIRVIRISRILAKLAIADQRINKEKRLLVCWNVIDGTSGTPRGDRSAARRRAGDGGDWREISAR